LDRNNRNFILFSTAVVLLLFTAIIIFNYIYAYSTINTYRYILFLIILVTIITALIFFVAMLAVNSTYRSKSINTLLIWPVKIGLKFLLPFTVFLSGFFKGNKDEIRKLYIEVNNILVESENRKYRPKHVLVLLPHCLQDSGCEYKITNDMGNCRKCGRCCIGDIIEAAEGKGVKIRTVTGGTAARAVVNSIRPRIILSVACERDLMSGIADVMDIPVIGITNERPNGPCNNTRVDVEVLKKKLEGILKS